MHMGPLCNCRISIELPNDGWTTKKKKHNQQSWDESKRATAKNWHKLLLWHSENVHLQSVGKFCEQRICAMGQMVELPWKDNKSAKRASSRRTRTNQHVDRFSFLCSYKTVTCSDHSMAIEATVSIYTKNKKIMNTLHFTGHFGVVHNFFYFYILQLIIIMIMDRNRRSIHTTTQQKH